MCTEKKVMGGYSKKMAVYKPRREASLETSCAGTWRTLDFLCSQCPALSLRACQRTRRSGAEEKATFAASLGACSKHWFYWPVLGVCFVLCCFPTGRLCYYALNCGVFYSEI